MKEQRDAKDLEFEESRKFKNMIRGLDEDEVDHLADVDNRKIIEERKQKEEELKELQDYRAKVAELQEISADQVESNLLNIFSNILPFNHQKLNTALSKPKPKESVSRTSQKAILATVVKRKSQAPTSPQEPPEKRQIIQRPSALKCLAVLPGIGDYKSSDDSDGSSECEDLDLRRLIRNKKQECDE